MVHPMGPSKIGLKVQGVTFKLNCHYGNIIFSPILTERKSFLSHLTICSLYNFLTFFFQKSSLRFRISIFVKIIRGGGSTLNSFGALKVRYIIQDDLWNFIKLENVT